MPLCTAVDISYRKIGKLKEFWRWMWPLQKQRQVETQNLTPKTDVRSSEGNFNTSVHRMLANGQKIGLQTDQRNHYTFLTNKSVT